MNKRAIVITGIAIIILAVFAIGTWALVRWHYQCLMLERLSWFKGIQNWQTEDAAYAKAQVEACVAGQYEQIEYYLSHPFRLDPNPPNSMTEEISELTLWKSIHPSEWLPKVKAQHADFLFLIGITNNSQFYDRIREARNHLITNNTQQGGPGYPPQGVGSPDP